MNSFNHYSLGSVSEWLYRYVAGIDLDPEVPGFRKIAIHPYPDKRLEYAHAQYQSIEGNIASGSNDFLKPLKIYIVEYVILGVIHTASLPHIRSFVTTLSHNFESCAIMSIYLAPHTSISNPMSGRMKTT